MAVNRQDEYFDKLETMTATAREKYQCRKLAETVSNAYKNAPAVKEMLDKAGVKPSGIKTVKDLEKLPITRKTDLIEMQKANPPYGGLLATPPEDVERVFLSPGPVYEPIQHSGVKWFAKSMWAAGFRKGDVAINSFTYHMSPAGILMHEAIKDCGTTVIPMGIGHTEIQVKTMLDLKVTGFVGTPSFLMAVIKQAEDMGYDFRKDFATKKAWFTGEMLATSIRETLENDYGVDTYQAYAVTEPGGAIAYECSYKNGMHLMDEYIVEIADPETGKQLPPGETGEIVVTPVHNHTWGLIRFGTGDLSSYTTEACPCGRTTYRIAGIVGRASDAVKVRGMFVIARQADGVFSGFEEIAGYQLIVGRRQHRDEITLRLELKDTGADKNKLCDAMNSRFQDTCRLKIDKIEFVAGGTIPKERKTIEDQRTWE